MPLEKRVLEYPENTSPGLDDVAYQVKSGGGPNSDVHVKNQNLVNPQNVYDWTSPARTEVDSVNKSVQFIEAGYTPVGTAANALIYVENNNSSTGVYTDNKGTGPGLRADSVGGHGITCSTVGAAKNGIVAVGGITGGSGVRAQSGDNLSNSSMIIGNDASNDIKFNLTGQGRLAIGHDNPFKNVHLKFDEISPTTLLIENSNGDDDRGAQVAFKDRGTTGLDDIKIVGTKQEMNFYTSANKRMTVDSIGRVGIGSVSGDINAKLKVKSSSGAAIMVQGEDNTLASTAAIGLIADAGSNLSSIDSGSLIETERVDADNAKTLIKSRVSGDLSTDVTFRETSGFVADFTGSILIPNNKGYGAKDSGGGARTLLGLDTSNDVVLSTSGIAGNIHLETGATPKIALTADQNQRIGIGVDAGLTSKLEVCGPAGGATILKVDHDGSATGGIAFSSAASDVTKFIPAIITTEDSNGEGDGALLVIGVVDSDDISDSAALILEGRNTAGPLINRNILEVRTFNDLNLFVIGPDGKTTIDADLEVTGTLTQTTGTITKDVGVNGSNLSVQIGPDDIVKMTGHLTGVASLINGAVLATISAEMRPDRDVFFSVGSGSNSAPTISVVKLTSSTGVITFESPTTAVLTNVYLDQLVYKKSS